MQALTTIGLLAAAMCGAASVTSLIRWCPNVIVAIAQLMVPWLTGGTAIAAVIWAIGGQWLLAAIAAIALAPAFVLMLPFATRTRSATVTSQGEGQNDAELQVVFANLFTNNDEVDAAARQLLDTRADVMVVTELTDEIVAALDRAGASDRFPHRIHPTPIEGEYVVGIFSGRPLSGAAVDRIGDDVGLRLVVAAVDVGGSPLRMIAVHPDAPTDRDSFQRWRRQLHSLRRHLHTLDGPTALLGDLNTGTLQVPYAELVDGPLRDAHGEAGEGLTPSWGVAPWLPRWVPSVIARLDHLLVSSEVEVNDLRDLDPVGSDHRPFSARLTIRGEAHDESEATVRTR